ncbi:MAG: hypothetical protein ACRDNX_02950, partial [Gaiellaceae bacterium]
MALSHEVSGAVAVDVGGSGVRAAAVAKDGRMGAVERRELDASLPRAEVCGRIADAVAVAIPAFVLPDGTVSE